MMFSSLLLADLLLLQILVHPIASQATSDYKKWLKPNGSDGDFVETYTNGDNITLSWKKLNDSQADLWMTPFDTTQNSFAKIVHRKDSP